MGVTYTDECSGEKDDGDCCEGEHGDAVSLGLKSDVGRQSADFLVELVVSLGCKML